MPVILIPIGLFALYFLEQLLFRHFWDRGLSVRLSFDDRAVPEGQTTTLTETVTNRNFLSLHILEVQYATDIGLIVEGNENTSVSDRMHIVQIFSMRFYETVKRRLTVRAAKRGYYRILRTALVASDLFSTRQQYKNCDQHTFLYVYPGILKDSALDAACERLSGDAAAKRHLYEDPFLFRGLREYAPTDPARNVNWKASARAGELMVNLFDPTASREICILLNLEDPAIYYESALLEDSIRAAYTMAAYLIGQKLSVSLVTTGEDLITGEKIAAEAGSSQDHLRAVAEALARIDLTRGRDGFSEMARREIRSARAGSVTYVIVSTSRRDQVIASAEALIASGSDVMWLCPVTRSMEDVAIPARVDFVKLVRELGL